MFELKLDGFRAIVSTEDGFQVGSRRAWNMTDRVPELRELPPGLVLDGELVAFNAAGAPHWPLVVERVLHGNTSIPVSFVAFDLLRVNGHDITCNPWTQRRTLLEGIWVERGWARQVCLNRVAFPIASARGPRVMRYYWALLFGRFRLVEFEDVK